MVCMAHYVTLTPSLKANIVWLSYERKDAFFLSLFRWVNDFSTHFSRWFIVSKNASTAATESNFKTQRLSVFPETSSIYGAGVGVTNHTWTASDVAGISGICSCSCLDTNAPPSEKTTLPCSASTSTDTGISVYEQRCLFGLVLSWESASPRRTSQPEKHLNMVRG